MNAPMFSDPDVQAWYERQIARAKSYRKMIAARRSGKSTAPAFCAPGTKVLIMPDDFTVTQADRAKLVELQNFAWKIDTDAAIERHRLTLAYHELKGS